MYTARGSQSLAISQTNEIKTLSDSDDLYDLILTQFESPPKSSDYYGI